MLGLKGHVGSTPTPGTLRFVPYTSPCARPRFSATLLRMQLLLAVLAVVGIAAVLSRAMHALFSLLRGGIDMFVARDLGDVRRQRGDLTGMEEAAALRRSGRQLRARGIARLSLWVGLLIVPVLTAWPLQLCAAYSILWLLPGGGMPVRTPGNIAVR